MTEDVDAPSWPFPLSTPTRRFCSGGAFIARDQWGRRVGLRGHVDNGQRVWHRARHRAKNIRIGRTSMADCSNMKIKNSYRPPGVFSLQPASGDNDKDSRHFFVGPDQVMIVKM